MTNNDLEKEIETVAVRVEQKISETAALLEETPDFEPRSQRSRKLSRVMNKR